MAACRCRCTPSPPPPPTPPLPGGPSPDAEAPHLHLCVCLLRPPPAPARCHPIPAKPLLPAGCCPSSSLSSCPHSSPPPPNLRPSLLPPPPSRPGPRYRAGPCAAQAAADDARVPVHHARHAARQPGLQGLLQRRLGSAAGQVGRGWRGRGGGRMRRAYRPLHMNLPPSACVCRVSAMGRCRTGFPTLTQTRMRL